MTHELENIEKELVKLQDNVLEEFRGAWELLSDILGDEELLIWARECLETSRQSARSGEVLVECFRASPHVAKYLTLPTFLQWLRSGRNLCDEVPSLAARFFHLSPELLKHVSFWGALKTPGLGRLVDAGICWGFGISFFDLTLDFASDARIYEFDTANWKIGLAWNQ